MPTSIYTSQLPGHKSIAVLALQHNLRSRSLGTCSFREAFSAYQLPSHVTTDQELGVDRDQPCIAGHNRWCGGKRPYTSVSTCLSHESVKHIGSPELGARDSAVCSRLVYAASRLTIPLFTPQETARSILSPCPLEAVGSSRSIARCQ